MVELKHGCFKLFIELFMQIISKMSRRFNSKEVNFVSLKLIYTVSGFRPFFMFLFFENVWLFRPHFLSSFPH